MLWFNVTLKNEGIMNKKVLNIFALLVFLWSENNALAIRPTAEEWNDQDNNPAPARVIQAANKLWDAVEAKHAAKNHMDSLEPSFWDMLRDSFSPKILMLTILRQPLPFEDTEYKEAADVHIRRMCELSPIWYDFQQTVREHVAGRYWFGDLAEDDMHDELAPNQQWKVTLDIDNRDMGAVLLGTLEFVNAWGGWAREFSPDSVRVRVRFPNSNQDVDIDDFEDDDERLSRMMGLLDNLGYRWIDEPTSQPSGNGAVAKIERFVQSF